MKNIRKLLSLLLVAFMVTAMVPFAALPVSAAGAEDIVIPSVSATVAQPYDGEEQNFDVDIPANSNYTAEISHWLWSTIHAMEKGELFQGAVNYYYVDLVFTPNEGYAFAENATATINGREAEFIGIGDSGKAYFRLGLNLLLSHNVLENVQVTVGRPTVGQGLDFHPVVPEQSLYSVADVHWYSFDEGNHKVELDENYVASAEDAFEFYYFELTLEVADGYVLQEDEVFINGKCSSDTGMTEYATEKGNHLFTCDTRSFWEVNPEHTVLSITGFESAHLTKPDGIVVRADEPISIKVTTNGGVMPENIGGAIWTMFGDNASLLQLEVDPSGDFAMITGAIPESSTNDITVRINWRYPWGSGGYKEEELSTDIVRIRVYDENADIEFLTDSELPDGKRNQGYVQPILATNIQGFFVNSLTYSIISGSLPEGLELRYDSILGNQYEYVGNYLFLSGTPKESGTFTFTVEMVGTLTGKDIRTFTVHFDKTVHQINFGEGPYGFCYASEQLPSVTVYDGATYEIPKKFPVTRTSYVQIGWSTEMYGDKNDVITSIATESSSVILYPVWVKTANCPHYYGEAVEAVAPTCDSSGNIQYYSCISCYKMFADEQLTTPTTWAEVNVPPTGAHTMYYNQYSAPTCRKNGSIEYWYCSSCQTIYLDEEGTESWHKPTYIMSSGCQDANNDGTCDVCGGKMPQYIKVTSADQIMAETRYILVAGNKAMVLPPIVTDKNGHMSFDPNYDYHTYGFPTTDVTVTEGKIALANGAVAFKGMQVYGDWKAPGGRTKFSMQAFIDGTMIALSNGNSAEIDQESKYGHCIIFENGVAKLVSAYEGDQMTFMYSYNIVGDPTHTTYIAGEPYQTVTDELGTRYYSRFSLWDEETQTEVPIEIENITEVVLYYEMQSASTPNFVSFNFGKRPSDVTPYDFELIPVDTEDFGGCAVIGTINALKPGELESIAEEAGVSEGDFVGVGTKFELNDYVLGGDGDGFMSIDVTPHIYIGETEVPIDSSSFDGSEMTVTVWAGKSNPNQIIHIKHDNTREYFYREYCAEAPEGAKYFTVSEVYDTENGYEYLGEFVTFVLTEFSPIELRETILPEIKGGFGQVNISLGSDITVHYYIADNSYEAPEMRFTINEYTKTVDGVKDGAQWKFSFDGVAPQWIGDTITAEFIIGGNVLATKSDYSVKAYLVALKAKTAAELDYTSAQKAAMDTLVDDLLCYGGAAQAYVNYNTENLVSEGITGTAFATLAATDKTKKDNGTYVTFTGANMYFNNANRLLFKFTSDDMTGVTLKIKVNGGAETEVACTAEGEYYVVTTDAITAAGFDDVYTVTAYKNNVAGATVTYSVKSYVYAMQDSENANMQALAKATYNYGLSAKAFVSAS